MSTKTVILASGSPWRRRLLKKHGVVFKVVVSNFKERKTHETPRMVAIHNACGKAESVLKKHPHATVIGIDTVGVLRGKVFGKPKNRAHARRMLLSISGTVHRVISGMCVLDGQSGVRIVTAVTTKVHFKKLDEQELERYLDSGQWKGKAGAYAIQGRAKGFVKKIDGDLSNVVGIPIPQLLSILKKLHIVK